MAATKTNPAHLALQVSSRLQALVCKANRTDEPVSHEGSRAQAATGVLLTGVGYFSLFKNDTEPKAALEARDASISVHETQDSVKALDKEAQNSSNKYWKTDKS